MAVLKVPFERKEAGMSKRKFALLAVCAGLFVNLSFAATKKSERHRNQLADWSDGALRNGDLPDTGSIVSGSGSGFQLGGGYKRSGPPNPEPISMPDNWNGGAGNWSSSNWSTGSSPGATNDVTIYSGCACDYVTLDVSATINSLTLGGATGGTGTSVLTDAGAAQTLTITQGLTIGQTGVLNLSGIGSAVTAGADSSNAGQIQLSNGSSLFINADLDNSGNIFTNGGASAVNVTATLTNEAGGQLILNGPGDTATLGGLANAGTVDVENGSTLQINGDVSNSGTLGTSLNGGSGGNTLNITGTLTNNNAFELLGAGDKATLGGLVNSAGLDVDHGSTLQINGDAINSGVVTTNNAGLGGGNQINISGMLTNQVTGEFNLLGPGDMATLGSLDNSGLVGVFNGSTMQVNGGVTNEGIAQFIVDGGSTATMSSLDNSAFIDVKSGSTLQVNGDATNSGNIVTDFNGTGGAMVNIIGMLTNQAGGQFALLGPGDMATLGSLDNSGLVNVESDHSTLQKNGDVSNSGGIYTSLNGSGGNTININGTLTNSGTFELGGPGDTGTIGSGVTNNAGGLVDVENGSTLTITGDVNNSASLSTNQFGTGGGNNLTITGTLTNQASGQFVLNGPSGPGIRL